MSDRPNPAQRQQQGPIRNIRNTSIPSDQRCCGCCACSGSLDPSEGDGVASRSAAAAPEPRLLYRVQEVAHLLNISRSRVFELLRSGELRSVTQGRTRLVPRNALFDFIAALETRHEEAS